MPRQSDYPPLQAALAHIESIIYNPFETQEEQHDTEEPNGTHESDNKEAVEDAPEK